MKIDQYRRHDDSELKMLITLNERVVNLQKMLDEQKDNPCDTHGLRIKNLERAVWIIFTAVGLLTLHLFYGIVTKIAGM